MLPDVSAGAHGAKPLQCLLRDPRGDNYCLNYSGSFDSNIAIAELCIEAVFQCLTIQ